MPRLLAVQRTITSVPPNGRIPPEAISEINAQRKRVSIDPGSRPAAIIAISRGTEGIHDAPTVPALCFEDTSNLFWIMRNLEWKCMAKHWHGCGLDAWQRYRATLQRSGSSADAFPGRELSRHEGRFPTHLRVSPPFRIQSNSPKTVDGAAFRIDSMRCGF